MNRSLERALPFEYAHFRQNRLSSGVTDGVRARDWNTEMFKDWMDSWIPERDRELIKGTRNALVDSDAELTRGWS